MMSPFAIFEEWYKLALEADIIQPDAMSLATCSADMEVTCRMVLFKGLDNNDFIFYTNYKSKKATQLDSNPSVALVFHWPQLQKQINIEGKATKLSKVKSDEYAKSRPYESQIAAWASPQSQIISGRSYLEKEFAGYFEKYKGKMVERPTFWGGYRVTPSRIEFWQARENRLHDRLQFVRSTKNGWEFQILAP